jgi:hypothetical protein
MAVSMAAFASNFSLYSGGGGGGVRGGVWIVWTGAGGGVAGGGVWAVTCPESASTMGSTCSNIGVNLLQCVSLPGQ